MVRYQNIIDRGYSACGEYNGRGEGWAQRLPNEASSASWAHACSRIFLGLIVCIYIQHGKETHGIMRKRGYPCQISLANVVSLSTLHRCSMKSPSPSTPGPYD